MNDTLRDCWLFTPGHKEHWIQVSHSNYANELPPEPGTLVDIQPDGFLVIEMENNNTDTERSISTSVEADITRVPNPHDYPSEIKYLLSPASEVVGKFGGNQSAWVVL